MNTVHLTIALNSFVGHPYRPEMEQFINITKESGMNRARSSENRRKALEEHLRNIGMTLTEFEALEALAHDPWYTDTEGFIEIPAKSVAAMIVATCDTIRAASRPCPPDMVRTLLRPSKWTTSARPDDATTWSRFAVVTSGTGAKLSNQRALRKNAVIGSEPPEGEPGKPVTATGTLLLNDEMVEPEVLHRALIWGGERVGIGASRKMGWGRFTVTGFDIDPD